MDQDKYLEDKLTEMLLKRKEQKSKKTQEKKAETTTYHILADRKQDNSSLKAAVTLMAVIIISVTSYFMFSTHQPPAGPQGRILSPTPGSITNYEVSVTGETFNIENGQFIWLAVDKPDLGLCWPKYLMLKPNVKFKTTIEERGPTEPYYLSLYVLNQDMHNHWHAWTKAEKMGGLPMLPKNRRLDTVRLMLGG